MNITAYIKDKIASIDAGDAFTYDDLAISQGEFTAASKSLSRLVTAGTIKRYRKGVYYKPKQTDFGELRPSDTELLNIYLFEDNKQVAYITGVRLYNQFRLTTQVPNVVRIASFSKQVRGKVGNTMVRPAKSYVTVSKKNIPLLQVLDVAKDFKNIPDGDSSQILSFLKNRIAQFSAKDLERFTAFAKAYPPKVAALIGAIYEFMGLEKQSNALRENINALSTYTFGISKDLLPTINNWNIA
ncbi:DUF6088 family protein [Nonlabens agnitus]|uniref:AbiEi antitoxin C-terminal domain-containing protein n=1 Tax=Nonlabens agnitus TaxID=870484 RepID=A0A2S9WQX2_9FLAO|nr:DUF6088 family protein [Nonlabens agnitus]PRP65858.1 hypothetical protein BST86_01510 [Nonlabens agnitus]